jgi:hypothetical protein
MTELRITACKRILFLLKKISASLRKLYYNPKVFLRYFYKMCLFMLKIKEIKPPPLFIPLRMFNQYTLNRKIKLSYWYIDSTYSSTKPLIYKKSEIDSYIEKIRNGRSFYYGDTDIWLYQALKKHSIRDKNIAVMGSNIPLYESICIFMGGYLQL